MLRRSQDANMAELAVPRNGPPGLGDFPTAVRQHDVFCDAGIDATLADNAGYQILEKSLGV
jgi:hypothetical protein